MSSPVDTQINHIYVIISKRYTDRTCEKEICRRDRIVFKNISNVVPDMSCPADCRRPEVPDFKIISVCDRLFDIILGVANICEDPDQRSEHTRSRLYPIFIISKELSAPRLSVFLKSYRGSTAIISKDLSISHLGVFLKNTEVLLYHEAILPSLKIT